MKFVNMKKIKIILFIICSLLIFSPGVLVNAGPLDSGTTDEIHLNQDAFRANVGYSETDAKGIGMIMASIIKAFLGLLGIIFIVLIIYAGYNYMTAAGDEAKIEKAIKTIQRAIIGLIIIVAAYSITAFVFNNLPSGGGSSGGMTSGT